VPKLYLRSVRHSPPRNIPAGGLLANREDLSADGPCRFSVGKLTGSPAMGLGSPKFLIPASRPTHHVTLRLSRSDTTATISSDVDGAPPSRGGFLCVVRDGRKITLSAIWKKKRSTKEVSVPGTRVPCTNIDHSMVLVLNWSPRVEA